MRYLLIILCILLFSCNNESSLKKKELELKEKELNLREKEFAQKEQANSGQSTQKEQANSEYSKGETKRERKLRYLFYSNGGLIGYFDDGTIAGCPRCDLLKENIQHLYSAKPYSRYTIEGTYLLVNGKDREYPDSDKNDSGEGWAMVDYKWYVNL